MSLQLPHSLYQAVLDSLDDDGPRLACADWFERNGQEPRARVIRLQCEAARLTSSDSRYWQIANEARNLIWQNRKDWLAGRPERSGLQWRFERGFPECVEVDSFKTLDELGEAIFSHPVRRLHFTAMRSTARLARCEYLTHVSELDLNWRNLGNAGIQTLATSPYLRNIIWLDLALNSIADAGFAALVTASVGPLTHLEVGSRRYSGGNNHVSAASAQALANWPALAHLRYLGLNRTGLDDQGLTALARSPHLSGLTSIDLCENSITAAGLAALAETECWPNLRILRLSGTRLGDDGLAELARCRQFRQLTVLDLSRARVGDPGCIALVSESWIGRLESLDLSSNAIGNPGAEAIAKSPYLSALAWLQLSNNLIRDDGGWALGRSSTLTALRSINVTSNAIQRPLESAIAKRFTTNNPAEMDSVKLQEAPTGPVDLAPPPPLPQTNAPVDEDGIWQGIVDDPDDDLPRLVYADWLEENGHAERAELIRLQCSPDWRGASDREKELIAKNKAAWLGPLKDVAEDAFFSRGLMRPLIRVRTFLVKSFQANAANWLRQTRASGITLDGSMSNWAKLAESPVLGAVHHLGLTGNDVGRLILPALAKSADLQALHTLNLFSSWVNHENLNVFLQSGRVPRLRRLKLHNIGVHLALLQTLVCWPGAGRLTTLSFPQSRLSAADFAMLVNSPVLSGLRGLNLASNYGIGESGARTLAESSVLCNLTKLDLSACNITPEGAVALAGSPLLARLEYLSLANNLIADTGALALVSSPHLSRLRTLVLSERNLSADCIAELRRQLGERLVLSNHGCWNG